MHTNSFKRPPVSEFYMTYFSSRWVHFVPFLKVARAEICSSDTLTQCVNSVYLVCTVWKSACFLRRGEEWDISLNELHSQCNWRKIRWWACSVFARSYGDFACLCGFYRLTYLKKKKKEKKIANKTVFWHLHRSLAWSTNGTGTLFWVFPTIAKNIFELVGSGLPAPQPLASSMPCVSPVNFFFK